ncbi:MAG: CBS domain-containing protein [Deltaproteobacteria bacterium]|nr:CBS domain-containing protein [Deltaproteobacteria bacterium]
MGGFRSSCREYMSSPVYSVPPGATLTEVRDELIARKVSCVAVIDLDNDALLGVVTRSDLYRSGRLSHRTGVENLELPKATVTSLMTTSPICVDAAATVAEAALRMLDHKVHRVLITDDSGVVGVLSARDVMRVVEEIQVAVPLSEIMSTPVLTVRHDQTIGEAVKLMDDAGVASLVVLDRGWPCGVLSQEELLAARQLDAGAGVEYALNPSMLVLPMKDPAYRCAGNARNLDVRLIIASRGFQVAGVVSPLDFCRLAV